ncbi:MAG: hypothetical protein ACOYMB_00980 [Patescibacteria group bacterium]
MKIYDCFTFFNELDLLEMRLNILDKDVDYFVIVEATSTHSGKDKELFFEMNKERFSKFSKKIIHIVVRDMPVIDGSDRWILENFQRNAVMRGLLDCGKDDIILISDLDEIPNLEHIENIKSSLIANSKSDYFYNFYISIRNYLNSLRSGNGLAKLVTRVINHFPVKSKCLVMFQQNIYYYYLNGFEHDHWFGTRAILFKNLVGQYNASPQQVRISMADTVIINGGWHFSYLLSPEGIINKIKSFAHSEFDQPEYTNVSYIKERITSGEDVFGGKERITYIELDSTYPKFIFDNQEKYSQYIYK